MAQFRSGTHWLKIETGRYENLTRAQRLCTECCVVEDEIHYLMECKQFCAEKANLLNMSSTLMANFDNLTKSDQFQQIMKSTDRQLLCTLGTLLIVTNANYEYKI